MANIKQIKIDSTPYDLAATYDKNGNDITSTYAPKNHASTATAYGVGNATDYGHVILYPAVECTSYTSDSGGACTPAAVKKAVGLFPPASHTHSYLPLSGGTLTGALYLNNNSNHRPAVLIKENNYWGLKDPSGGDGWIRTTTQGIIPNQSGSAGAGHGSLGTSTWYFSTAYIDNIYGYLNGNISGSSASCTGNAATASKLTTSSKGSATQPVYFSGGVPVACTYTLGKSVPSDAKFTDTTYDLSPYMKHHGLTSGSTPFNFDTQGGNWVLNVANSWTGTIPSGNYGWIGMIQFTGNHFYVQLAASVPNSSSNSSTAGGGGFFYRSRYTSQSFTSWARLDSRVYNEKGPAAGGYIVHSSEIGAFTPLNLDNTLDLGSTGNRWKNLYYRGSVNPSDIRLKTDLKKINEDERYIKLFDLIEPYTYKFIDGTSGRTHTGFISQYIEQHLEEVGLDSSECALFCKEKKRKTIQDDQGTVVDIVDVYDENGELDYDYMLNYLEYIAITAAKIKSLEKEYNQKFENQEKRISELENLVLQLIENK